MRPALKIIFISWTRGHEQLISWKYLKLGKLIIAVEYPRVLKSPAFWICFWFWMSHSFRYTRILNITLVLNMPGFWIYQSSEYVRVLNISYTEFRLCLNNFRICLNMLDYTWISLNNPEYIGIYVNMPKHSRIAFVSHFPTSPFVLQSLFYLNT